LPTTAERSGRRERAYGVLSLGPCCYCERVGCCWLVRRELRGETAVETIACLVKGRTFTRVCVEE
jgi:hypothetical protein